MEDEVLPALRAWADSYGFTLLDYEWGGSCITNDDTQFLTVSTLMKNTACRFGHKSCLTILQVDMQGGMPHAAAAG